MGFLTTIMFRNDSWNIIRDNPRKVVENILDAMQNHEARHYGIDYDCNLMESVGASHADVNRLFLQWGNSLCEIGRNNLSIDTRKKMLKVIKKMISDEEREIKRVEKNLR
jgi:hypothetical protein